MTARSSVWILALVLFVPVVAGAQGRSAEQRQAAAQLAAPKLDTSRTIVSLELSPMPLRDIVETIARAGGVTVRYHSAVTKLDTPSVVKLTDSKVEDGLRTVLDPKSLTFAVTGAKSVFVYPNTPENREKYTDSVKTFPIAKANVNTLGQTLNQALTGAFGADDLRPTIVTNGDARTIAVRATPDVMAKIAKIIADNDK